VAVGVDAAHAADVAAEVALHGLARPQQAVRDRGPHLLVHLSRAVAATIDAQVQLTAAAQGRRSALDPRAA
jgi:hypothetical protein